MPDITLDGIEITVIKALGLSGGAIDGKALLEKCAGLGDVEVIEALSSLIDQGLVDADSSNYSTPDAMKHVGFHVNSGYVKEIKEAMDPKPKEKKSDRQRRE